MTAMGLHKVNKLYDDGQQACTNVSRKDNKKEKPNDI